MNVIYGYARCSTNELRQDIDRQKRELFKLGVEDKKNIFFEYESGTKTDRVELQKLLDALKPGDSIVVTEVSRLSRSTKHLCEIIQLVQNRNIRLIIGNFIVDCRSSEIDAMTKGMILMWGVFSEMERDMISCRVKSGMESARAKGRRIGRPGLRLSDLPPKFLQYYPDYKAEKMSLSDLAKISGKSRTTIYKYVSLMKESGR